MDIGFHCFDVSADGNVEAKVYWHLFFLCRLRLVKKFNIYCKTKTLRYYRLLILGIRSRHGRCYQL